MKPRKSRARKKRSNSSSRKKRKRSASAAKPAKKSKSTHAAKPARTTPKRRKSKPKPKPSPSPKAKDGKRSRKQKASTLGLTQKEAREYFNDSAGDKDEEWNEIDYFAFEEAATFQDTSEANYSGGRGRKSVGETLARLAKIYSKRDLQTGQLYNKESERKQRGNAIKLQAVFVSDDGQFMVREHMLYSQSTVRSPKEFHDYLSENYGTILRKSILPGLSLRTNDQQWRVYRVIGWHYAHSKSSNTATRKRRNKTKR